MPPLGDSTSIQSSQDRSSHRIDRVSSGPRAQGDPPSDAVGSCGSGGNSDPVANPGAAGVTPEVEILPSDSDAPARGGRRLGPVTAERLETALQRLVGSTAAARRLAVGHRTGQLRLDAVWGLDGPTGGFESVAVLMRNAGRTAGVLLSPVRNRSEIQPAAELIRALLADRRFDADLAQAMLDPARPLDREPLLAAGFESLAELRFMDRPLPGPSIAPTHRDNGSIRIETCGDEPPASLHRLLLETYRKTLDCPGLAGARRVEDVLEGHRAAGHFRADFWRRLLVDGVPAGLSLLNPNPDAGCVELVYFGLAESFRGRGLAAALLGDSIRIAGGAGLPRLSLAVDDRNIPALRLYRRHGFVPGAVRSALVKRLRTPDTTVA
jgi:GNAT superfamily N-acetyltransferase